mmetsp:Transcript_5229/g.8098  ORF Transcript_5229/g.8098 Transcript_5229/m.8098 type:complete len:140 (+) Transcript_5229:680-1099(+)
MHQYSTKFGVALLTSCLFLSLCFIVVPLLGLTEVKHHNAIKMTIYLCSAIVGLLVGARLSNGISIAATAFLGSYFLVRGISLFTGGFINEFDLADIDDGKELSEAELANEQVKPIFFGYLGLIAFFFVLGLIIQRRQLK